LITLYKPLKRSQSYIQMPAPIPPLIRKQIEKAFLRSEGSLDDLAKRFNVSVPTVRRITKGLKINREAAEQVVGTAIADHVRQTVTVSGVAIDQNELLLTAINDLSHSVKSTEAKSKEGAATALVKLLDAWRDRNPETMQEIISRCLELGYSADDFFKALDAAWAAQSKV
jgi:urease gamma subunit